MSWLPPDAASGPPIAPRHSGDPPERPRSVSRCRFRPCLGRWLRSGSPAVEVVAIRGRKEALDARIFGSPPRSLPSGYALIPGSRRCCTSNWSRGHASVSNIDRCRRHAMTPAHFRQRRPEDRPTAESFPAIFLIFVEAAQVRSVGRPIHTPARLPLREWSD